jgi:hypothetical protein
MARAEEVVTVDDIRWDEFSNPPGAADPHPSDLDFSARAPEALKHADDCAYCQRRLDAAGSSPTPWAPDLDDDESFEAHVRARLAAGAGAELARVTALSAPVQALLGDTVTEAEVTAGQVWRLRWDTQQILVAVIAVHGWLVEVAPVSTDAEHADSFTWRLPADATDLGVDLGAVLSAEGTVPLFTFERLVADLRRTVGAEAPSVLRALQRAVRTGDLPPPEIPTGPVTGELDIDRVELRTALQEQLAPFVAAAYAVPEGAAEDALSELVRQRSGDDPAAFTDAGVTPGIYLRISRGERATPEVAAKLAEALGLTVEQVLELNPPLPPVAILEVSRPRLRHRFESSAEPVSEVMRARWLVAENALAGAARTVSGSELVDDGGGGDPALAARVESALDDWLRRRHDTGN